MAQHPFVSQGGQKKISSESVSYTLTDQTSSKELRLYFRKTWGKYVLAVCTYARSAESLGRPEHVLQATRAYSALPAGHIIPTNVPAEDLCLQNAKYPSECMSFFPPKTSVNL